MFENLNDENFLLFAAKAYEKPTAIMSEFEEDLNRILYLKRLLSKFYVSKILKDRLIMNHIIVLYNVFGVEAATRMLFLKLDNKDLEVIKPFLIFLNLLPNIVYGINGKNILTDEIELNQETVTCLRNLR